ncbi:WG repeat-containing protein [Runella sp.]|uniref:WG repeat-containing protein n=1 Tax=Runella sp. TaxID=1960881 RepID=UPI003D09A441
MKKYILKISLIALNLLWFISQSFAQLNADFLRHKKLADDCFGKKDYECAIKQYTIANKVKRDDYCLQQIEKCKEENAFAQEKKLEVDKNKKDVVRKIADDDLRVKVRNGKWGIIDKTNRVIIPFVYDHTHGFEDGLAAVKKNGKWGFIDKMNRVIIAFEYESAFGFNEGLSKVKKNGKFGFIDKTNRAIVPFEYDEWIPDFSEGLVRVSKNGKFGFIDKTSRVIIPFEYEAAERFQEGLVAAKKNGKFGFIDKTNRVIIPFEFDAVILYGGFTNGSVPVKKSGQIFYINKQGQCIKDCP